MIFEKMLKDLPELPSFKPYWKEDINLLSGRIKRRKLHNPNDAMLELHRRFLCYLRSLPVSMKYSKGYRPGRKAMDHVTPHLKNRFFYLTDIRNAFSTTSIEAVAETLCKVDPRLSKEETLQFLQKFCADKDKGGIVLGGPASSELFNLFLAVRIDGFLGHLCTEKRIVYTRYQDDLVFSSRRKISFKTRKKIQSAIRSSGLETSSVKTQTADLQKEEVVINGMRVSWGGQVFLRRAYLKRLLGLVHLAEAGKLPPAKVYGSMSPFIQLVRFRKGELKTQQEIALWEKYSKWKELQK